MSTIFFQQHVLNFVSLSCFGNSHNISNLPPAKDYDLQKAQMVFSNFQQ